MPPGLTLETRTSLRKTRKTFGRRARHTGYDIILLLVQPFFIQVPQGPDLHGLQPGRRTINEHGEVLEDEWKKGNSIRIWNEKPWAGKTYFGKQPPGHELATGDINNIFLKLLNCSSQGGFVMMLYDKRMETEKQPHMVSVTSWVSTKLKRKTVNTLSAECQALIYGVGQIHWHRFLLLELMGNNMNDHQWEEKLTSIPYISVVDSRSLYDCINKLVCTFSRVEGKRTAIDLAILRDVTNRTSGSPRWVTGTNMITDPMTKRMNSSFLKHVCNKGYWPLSEEGNSRQRKEHDLLLIMLAR